MVEADNHRETVKASVLAKAEEYLANFDSYDMVLEDAEKGFIAKQTW